MDSERGFRLPSVIILLAAAFACGLPALVYPFGKDQGTFALVGRIILDGGVPYRDAWDVKPPAIFYIYALAEWLFGHSMSSIRLLDLVWQGATALLVYAIARRVSRREAPALAAGLIYVAAYWIHGFWNTAQSDGFINLPLAAAVLLFLGAAERRKVALSSLAAGALTGAAFYLKYPAALMLPVFWIFLARGGETGRLRRSMLIGAGFAAAAGGCLLYLHLAGALREFASIQLSFVPNYWKVLSTSAAGPRGPFFFLRLTDLFGSFFVYPPLILLSICAYLFSFRRKGSSPARHLVAAWGLAGLAGLYLQGKFYIYHFLPLLPPLSIGASFALCFTFDGRRSRGVRIPAIAGIILVCVLSWRFSNPRYARYCARVYVESGKALRDRLVEGAVPDDYYMNVRFTSDDFSFPADRAVAGYLKERVPARGGIYLWGFEPIVYWLAERKSPSPFIHNFPLRGGWAPPRYARALEESLKNNPPLYFLVVRNDPFPWMTGSNEDSAAALRRYPALTEWIAENYTPETRIEDFDIYKRNRINADKRR